jgi:hypothetical protein
MIPPLDPTTGNLPPGVHQAGWQEVVAAFGATPHRQRLLAGLRRAAQSLRLAGCRTLYLDGSFVTGKLVPGDYDGCWDAAGVNPTLLDDVLLDMSNGRLRQKAKYGGELFVAGWIESGSGRSFLEFFQTDKDTGNLKGIVALDLGSVK